MDNNSFIINLDEEDFLKYAIALWFWSMNLTSKVFTLWNRYVSYVKQKRIKKEGNTILCNDWTKEKDVVNFQKNNNRLYFGEDKALWENETDMLPKYMKGVSCDNFDVYEMGETKENDYNDQNKSLFLSKHNTLTKDMDNFIFLKKGDKYNKINAILTIGALAHINIDDKKLLVADQLTCGEEFEASNSCKKNDFKTVMTDEIGESELSKNDGHQPMSECDSDGCRDNKAENNDGVLGCYANTYFSHNLYYDESEKTDDIGSIDGDHVYMAANYWKSADDSSCDGFGDNSESDKEILSHMENINDDKSVTKENSNNASFILNSDQLLTDFCQEVKRAEITPLGISDSPINSVQNKSTNVEILHEMSLTFPKRAESMNKSDLSHSPLPCHPRLMPPIAFQSNDSTMNLKVQPCKRTPVEDVDVIPVALNQSPEIKGMANNMNEQWKRGVIKETENFGPVCANGNTNNMQPKFDDLIDLSELACEPCSFIKMKNRFKDALKHAQMDLLLNLSSGCMAQNLREPIFRMKTKHPSCVMNVKNNNHRFVHLCPVVANYSAINRKNYFVNSKKIVSHASPTNSSQKLENSQEIYLEKGSIDITCQASTTQKFNTLKSVSTSNDISSKSSKTLHSKTFDKSSPSTSFESIQSNERKNCNQSGIDILQLEYSKKYEEKWNDFDLMKKDLSGDDFCVKELGLIKQQLVNYQDLNRRLEHLVEAQKELVEILNCTRSKISPDVILRACSILEKLDNEISDLKTRRSSEKSVCILLAKKAEDLICKYIT